MSWGAEDWSSFGDVTIEDHNYEEFCEPKFENELVAIPEPVTFPEAAFICDFLSGKIYSVDDDLYDSLQFYANLKENLNLKVCQQNVVVITKSTCFYFPFYCYEGGTYL